MGQWVIAVAGIAILSVLCDVIIPEGQTRKYVKTVFGIVVTLVIVQPLIGIFNGDWKFSAETDTIELQQGYIDNVNNRQLRESVASFDKFMQANGIEASVCINSDSVKIIVSGSRSYATERKINEAVALYFPDVQAEIVWI